MLTALELPGGGTRLVAVARFIVGIGAVIYLSCGRRHSRMAARP
jgi:hypothetical protein